MLYYILDQPLYILIVNIVSRTSIVQVKSKQFFNNRDIHVCLGMSLDLASPTTKIKRKMTSTTLLNRVKHKIK